MREKYRENGRRGGRDDVNGGETEARKDTGWGVMGERR